MKHFLTYAGRSSLDFGVCISGAGTFNAPERDVKSITVPGRNGELTVDNGRYKNITVKYPAFIANNFTGNVEYLRNFLLSQVGYKRLEDTYHPDEFRMARYMEDFTAGATKGMRAGNFTLSFNCMPQRFLKTGEDYISVSSGKSLLNPTQMTALPLIKITTTSSGDHRIDVGGIEVVCTRHSATIYIDCDLQEAYDSSFINVNSDIRLTHHVFPSLPAGETGIELTGCTAEIMPRWWRL